MDRIQELRDKKEKIKEEIQKYNKKLESLQLESREKRLFLDDSSDSDEIVIARPSIEPDSDIESMLINFEASRELTGLTVLEYEEIPMLYDCGPPVDEPGSWYEVIAECRMDLVPFSMTYHKYELGEGRCRLGSYTNMRKKNKMALQSNLRVYHGLTVSPVKNNQSVELESSLSAVKYPSAAVQLIKSYSKAYRSRRTTLAYIADKYEYDTETSGLRMEPLEQGGYSIKCGSIMELQWRLVNSNSKILSEFYHKLKFQFDHVDETRLEIIKQAYKEMTNPSTKTNQRTALLSKIMDISIELKALHDKRDYSETDVEQLEKTILEDNSEKRCENHPKNTEDFGQNVKNAGAKTSMTSTNLLNNPTTSARHTDHKDNANMPPLKSVQKKNRKLVKRPAEGDQNGKKQEKKVDKNKVVNSKNNYKENSENHPKINESFDQNVKKDLDNKNVKNGGKNCATKSVTSKNLLNNRKTSAQSDNVTEKMENAKMAPPKSIPKKTQPKPKNNTTDIRKAEQRTAEGDQNGKKQEKLVNVDKKAKSTKNSDQKVANVQKELNKSITVEKDRNVNKNEAGTSVMENINKKNKPESSNKRKIEDDKQNVAQKPKIRKQDKTATTSNKENNPTETAVNNTKSKELNNKKSSNNQAESTKNVAITKRLIKSHHNMPQSKKSGNDEGVKDGKISKIPRLKSNSNVATNIKNVLRLSPILKSQRRRSES